MHGMKYRTRRMCAIAASAMFSTMAICHQTSATWLFPNPVPVERLVENLTAYASENPNDAIGWYALGRVHSMAYIVGTTTLGAGYDRDNDGLEPEEILSDESDSSYGVKIMGAGRSKSLEPSLRLRHLASGIRTLEHAIGLGFDGDKKRFNEAASRLSVAHLIEKGIDDTTIVTVMPDIAVNSKDEARIAQLMSRFEDIDHLNYDLNNPNALWTAQRHILDEIKEAGALGIVALARSYEASRGRARSLARGELLAYWRTVAATRYFEAFKLGSEPTFLLPFGEDGGQHYQELIAWEAGTSFLRLNLERDELPAIDEMETEIRATLKRLAATGWKRAWVTPILFSFEQQGGLGELLAPNVFVSFDLDGTGRKQRWPWVKPDTAILVWDPDRTGRITSGRQLFGSVTWWLFFPDGYRALDALDDNRDGELAGAELAGLAIWMDANSNGVSDPGEVTAIEDTPIAGIETAAITTDGVSPANPIGLRLKHGRRLPTYDWVVREASPIDEETRED